MYRGRLDAFSNPDARTAMFAEVAVARGCPVYALRRLASFLYEAAHSRQSEELVAGGQPFALNFSLAFPLADDSHPSAAPVGGRRRLADASASPTPLHAARMNL